MTQREAEDLYVGKRFVETAGYHKGEKFECTSVHLDRDGWWMRGFWDCGAYTYELISTTTLKEIDNGKV